MKIANQECLITEEMESQCVPQINRGLLPRVLYPGYECSRDD
jgi:hypothetical protein